MKNRRNPLFWLLVIAFVVRGAAVWISTDSFNADPDQYRALAKNLQKEGVYGTGTVPTAFRPPLSPLVLRSAVVLTRSSDRPTAVDDEGASGGGFSLLLTENAAIALLHWGLGILTVLLVYRLALLLTLPPRWAFGAGLLTVVDPILLQQSRLVMTETLAAFLAVLILYLFVFSMRIKNVQRKNFAMGGLGGLLGLAALCRPTFLVFALLAFFVLIHYYWQKKVAPSVHGFFLAGVILVLIPWGLRNHVIFDKFIVTTTHGGYTLLLANNPFLYERNLHPGPFDGPWDAESFHQFWDKKLANDMEEYDVEPGSVQAELFQDELAKRVAQQTMKDDPDDCLFATLIRIGSLWQWLPYQTNPKESAPAALFRWGIGAFYAAEILIAFFGMGYILSPMFSRKRRHRIMSPYWSSWSWPLLLILAVQMVHLLYWTNMRMRAPFMTVISIMAVVGLRVLIRFAKKDPTPVIIGGTSAMNETESMVDKI